jgi:hypothetical protein
MMIVKSLILRLAKLSSVKYYERLPWIQYKHRWQPTWILRQSETVESGPSRIFEEYFSHSNSSTTHSWPNESSYNQHQQRKAD